MHDRRLTIRARELLQECDATRIEAVQTFPFVQYSIAKRIRKRLDELLAQPRSLRPASMLIAGPTNNGKTMLVNKFKEAYPLVDDPASLSLDAQVLYLQMPPSPEPRQFYLAILRALNSPVRTTAVLSHLQSQTVRLLTIAKVKILIIDEIHNILGGRFEQQRSFLNLLRYLSNENQIHIVCCGIPTAVRALQSDEQLANRFEHWALPRWRNDDSTRKLLNTIEMTLPLKFESNISKSDCMGRILGLSEGTIGEIMRLLSAAAQEAISTGHELIDVDLLDKMQWIPPSERRQAAERVLGLSR